MKKWMAVILIGSVTAGIATAETNSVPWWKKPFVKNTDEQTQVIPSAPEAAPQVSAPAPEKPHMQHRKGLSGEGRPQLTSEQKEKMKAMHEVLKKLGEAARNETDPVKKEALVSELRTKLTEVADRIQAEQKRRLAQAGKEMKNLEKRIADYDANKSARIEKQIQRILAGEPFKGPEGRHPEQPGGAKYKKAPPPDAE